MINFIFSGIKLQQMDNKPIRQTLLRISCTSKFLSQLYGHRAFCTSDMYDAGARLFQCLQPVICLSFHNDCQTFLQFQSFLCAPFLSLFSSLMCSYELVSTQRIMLNPFLADPIPSKIILSWSSFIVVLSFPA